MNIEKALEIARAVRTNHPDWVTEVNSGYGTSAHVVVSGYGVSFVIRQPSDDNLSLSGSYGSLSKYIQSGDNMPRRTIPANRTPDEVAEVCLTTFMEVGEYQAILEGRCQQAKGDYDSRLEVAHKLSHPGIKITNATDIWWQKKRFEVSGEILSGGNVSLSILCDSDTANLILETLKGVK